jgi:hypothetical protein
MTGFSVGSRSYVVVRYRMLLFEDRVEEVGGTLLGLEIRRLFFDEVQCATVHRGSAVLEVLAWGVGAVLLASGGVAAYLGGMPWVLLGLGVAALAAVLGAAHAAMRPPYVLVLRTADQALETRLSRDPTRRASVLGRLVRTIEPYQRGHAPALPPA